MSGRRCSWSVALCLGCVAVCTGVLRADEAMGRRRDAQLTMTTVGSSAERGNRFPESLESNPMHVSMEFEDANLKDVLKTFSQQTGINVIASDEISNRTVTLYLEDVTVMDALNQILDAANLYYEHPAGSQIYVVKPKLITEPKVATITKVYRLKYARVSSSRLARAVEALGSQTPFEAQQFTSTAGAVGATGGTGTSLSTGGGGGVGGGGGTGASSGEVGINRVIKELLTDQGKVVVDERTNSLIVSDVAENFPRIESALNALDVRTLQILIEAEVIETNLSKVKDLGIEWGTGTSGELFTFAPGSRTTTVPFNWLGLGSKSAGASRFSTSTLSAASFKGSLQALLTDTDTKILARPKVMTLENESAVIRLTTQQAIGFTTTTTGGTTNPVQATPERTTTGVILVVTPQVNEDGFVTMLVEPSVTKTVASAITPPSSVGGSIVDPKTRSARALVRIRQGDTLVLGGLIDRSEQAVVKRVPILSDIPIMGEVFKDKEINNLASELIVFVTPHILSESSGTKVASAGLSGPGASTTQAPPAAQEQKPTLSRQALIEDTLNRLVEQH